MPDVTALWEVRIVLEDETVQVSELIRPVVVEEECRTELVEAMIDEIVGR